MVVDHHQLDVLGLILYASRHMRSLRTKTTQTDRHAFLIFSQRGLFFKHQGQFQNSTHSKHKDLLMSHASQRKEINKDELCEAKLYLFF